MYGSSSDGMASTAAVQPSASESGIDSRRGVRDASPDGMLTRVESIRTAAAAWCADSAAARAVYGDMCGTAGAG